MCAGNDLFDPNWTVRHGAAIGLRELIGKHGATAGMVQDSGTRCVMACSEWHKAGVVFECGCVYICCTSVLCLLLSDWEIVTA